ncbi:MAG TPA: DUF2268 domain-containing putative Zn-dependent protease [Polyangiaceae bacterium]
MLVALLVSCSQQHVVDIELPHTGRSLTRQERAEVQRVADDAFRDVHAELEGLPPRLTLIVRWGKDVIPETGENGTASYPGNVMWTLDPDRDALETIRSQLRATLFHELHHLARASRVTTTTLVDRAVTEGLATAFERDAAHVDRHSRSPSAIDPPWAKAPDDASWEQDVLAQPSDAKVTRMAMRVGTAWADRAAHATGKTPATLVFASTDEILRAAKVR